MEINYTLVAAVLIAVLFLIAYLIRRNRKDEKIVEHELNMKEMKTEVHDDEEDAKV